MSRTPDTIIIIDDEFEKYEGHPYEYNKSVAESFRRHGFKTVIYSSRGISSTIQEELNARPWFYFNKTAAIRKVPLLGAMFYRYGFSRAFRQQMTALLKEIDRQYDNYLIFYPSAYWYNILPLAQSFRNIRHPFIFLYRFSIYDAVRVPKVMRPLIRSLIRHAAGILKRNRNIRHFTDSDVIAAEWEEAFSQPMSVVPIPHLHIPHNNTGKVFDPEKLRLYLPGTIRLEKGAELLTESMELLSRQHPELAKKITLVTQFPANDEMLDGYEQRLAALPVQNTFLGNLSTADYYGQLSEADIILIPYQLKEGYRARTSGVLAEAIGSKKPVITTAGTWMAQQVTKYDAGTIIEETPEALVAAILAMAGNYPAYRERAFAAAGEWMKFHSKDTFFNIVMNAIAQPAASG